ncbi:hypothetical protein AB9R84_10300 [Oceanimonas smirnovii]|uniref:nucleotidyltransferase domain-containing protein n=1 Tax=Oceanimonas smirnovii TaxID=264574 RepID=UPI003AAD583E
MRLSEQQQVLICRALKKHFGEQSRIWLFGSRVDDNARGGDIDLYIEPEVQSPAGIVDARIAAMVDIYRQLGEQKIDLVINRFAGPQLAIYDVAKKNGVELK